MTNPFPPPHIYRADAGIDTPAENQQQLPVYRSFVRQHPNRARISGMGENVSRRSFDPPLVIELDIIQPSPTKPTSLQTNYAPSQLSNMCNTVICTVVLYHAHEDKMMNVADIPPPPEKKHLWRYVPILLGETVRNPRYVMDVENQDTMKHLFVFSDLSVRIQGKFRLKCTVLDLVSGRVEHFFTKVFEVFSPQYYPGILEPTTLTKWLYTHGLSGRSAAGLHASSQKVPPNTKTERKRKSIATSSSSSSRSRLVGGASASISGAGTEQDHSTEKKKKSKEKRDSESTSTNLSDPDFEPR